MTRAPALFLSHGSPLFALRPGRIGPRLQALGAALSGLEAVLVVSPHWQAAELRVGSAAAPATLHDFGGFPAPLYQLGYPAPGAPGFARRAIELLRSAGLEAREDPQRGLDHGAWAPLRHLLPAANLPVFPLSLPRALDPAGTWQLGAALRPLRDEGVLVVGSGSLTHNLSEFGRPIDDPQYATEFADWIAAAVERRDRDALLDYRRRAPHAQRAHPTEEHFLPLLVAAGAGGDEPVTRIEGGLSDGTLSMDAYGWGLETAALRALAARGAGHSTDSADAARAPRS